MKKTPAKIIWCYICQCLLSSFFKYIGRRYTMVIERKYGYQDKCCLEKAHKATGYCNSMFPLYQSLILDTETVIIVRKKSWDRFQWLLISFICSSGCFNILGKKPWSDSRKSDLIDTTIKVPFLSLWHEVINFFSGFPVHCYIGNGTDALSAESIDCSSVGMQREELYCRNTTTPKGEIHRSCVAMSWWEGKKLSNKKVLIVINVQIQRSGRTQLFWTFSRPFQKTIFQKKHL